MIHRAELIRLEKAEDGTFGVLRLDGQVFCVTLEPPEKGNEVNVSCIPAGQYMCRRVESPRFGTTFELRDVPGRSDILFHPGNVSSDSRGCILLGRNFGFLRGDRAVLSSSRTFADFMKQSQEANAFPFAISEACEGGVWKTSA